MEAAALIGAVVLLTAAGRSSPARRVHVSNLDALELAAKVSVSDPVSALDWPELRVRAIGPQPGDQPLVLLRVGRAGHPPRRQPVGAAARPLVRHAGARFSDPARRSGPGATPPADPGASPRGPDRGRLRGVKAAGQ